MVEKNNPTQRYLESLREHAKRLDDDKYLLKLADAVEKNKGISSATVELAVASRIQTYNTNQIISQQISKMNEIIAGLVQYQQRCTDLAISAFGIPEEAVKPEESTEEGEPELQLDEEEEEEPTSIEEPEVVEKEIPEPQTPQTSKVPEAPRPKKTGKVPDFKAK